MANKPPQPWGLTVAQLCQFVYEEIYREIPPEKQKQALARSAVLMVVALHRVCQEHGGDAAALYKEQKEVVDEGLEKLLKIVNEKLS